MELFSIINKVLETHFSSKYLLLVKIIISYKIEEYLVKVRQKKSCKFNKF